MAPVSASSGVVFLMHSCFGKKASEQMAQDFQRAYANGYMRGFILETLKRIDLVKPAGSDAIGCGRRAVSIVAREQDTAS